MKPLEQQSERTYSKAELVSVLKRLESYYGERVRAALNTGRGDAPHWQAKQDTIQKVAENLDIVLGSELHDSEEQGRKVTRPHA